jgi:hypothetical protein
VMIYYPAGLSGVYYWAQAWLRGFIYRRRSRLAVDAPNNPRADSNP